MALTAMKAGIPDTVPAMNVNRLCGSGAQAIVSAVQSLMLQDAEFAVAGGVGSCGERLAQPGLEHVHHGLDLPALAVGLFIERCRHQPTPFALWQLVRRPADLRGDDRFDLQIIAQHLVVLLAVVAGVEQELAGHDLIGQVVHQRQELVDVRPRALATHVAEDHVRRAVDDDAQLHRILEMDETSTLPLCTWSARNS